MLGNILFYGGIFLLILGILFIIRFDGSIKRIIICGIMILIGFISIGIGSAQRNAQVVEYVITEVQPEIGRVACVEKERYLVDKENNATVDLPDGIWYYIDKNAADGLYVGKIITNKELEKIKK